MTTEPAFHTDNRLAAGDNRFKGDAAGFRSGTHFPVTLHSSSARRWSGASLATMIAGGSLTGLTAALFLSWPSTSEPHLLERLPLAEVGAAEQSLFAANGFALAEEAKSCRSALTSIAVRATGSNAGVVRIRSGVYRSPIIKIGPQQEKLALPFPAPIEVGHGQIFIETNAAGLEVFLTPGVVVPAGTTNAIINVRWDPRSACR